MKTIPGRSRLAAGVAAAVLLAGMASGCGKGTGAGFGSGDGSGDGGSGDQTGGDQSTAAGPDGRNSADGGRDGAGDGGDVGTGEDDTHGTEVRNGDGGPADAADSRPELEAELDLVQYVSPFIGTDDSNSPHPVPGGAGGSTYPGAVVPFGMVQLGPDTPTASPSGYRYGDNEIEQFSLTHLNGAGCPNDEDIPFLPIVGDLGKSPGTNWPYYKSGYKKATEEAAPGYYRVELDRYKILAELTTTTRTGFARFTFPPTSAARLLVHTGRSATGNWEGEVQIVAADRIEGTVAAGAFCWTPTAFLIHFAMEFDRPVTGYGTWLANKVSPGSDGTSGTASGVYVTFDTAASPVVQMKVGMSYVSVWNAWENLEEENAGWDFDQVRKAASDQWNTVLNRVQVTGGSPEDLSKFYTALYHAFQNPNVASDVNGEYMGFDGIVHSAGRITYQNFSGWDIIRSWMHLAAAVAPEGPDIVASMVQDGIEGGLLPFWTHQNVETHVMVGDPGTVNVANAYAMGVRGFDEGAALDLMKKSADNPYETQRWALEDWLNLHFVGNAAISLEYAMADFALAQFGKAVGDEAAYSKYLSRSDYWRESWNPEHGYIEPKFTTPAIGADAARIYEVQVFGPGAPSQNVAQGGTATASGQCNVLEGPEKAVNGTWDGGTSDKWCDNSGSDKWWQVDLGSVTQINKVVIYHAGAGGESPAWNTMEFRIEVSGDGGAGGAGGGWMEVAAVTDNSESVTGHEFSALGVRYVRIDIDKAIQGAAIGAWDCQPFDPAAECGFIEGNAAQYVWMVPHNLHGLFELMGGHASAVARLDDLFVELNSGTNSPHFYIGNEPEHGTPWTYNFAGAPWKTPEVVRRIVEEEFGTGPGGLPGNDDLGATSAWLVWAYLGLYPAIPGTDVLVLSGPFFPSAVVHLANGNVLTISGSGTEGTGEAGEPPKYIEGLLINGVPASKSWLRFADISTGGTLEFKMGTSPGTEWGTGEQDLPPSFPPY